MNGARVGITGTRRAEEQAALVRALGGVPVHGPSIDLDVPAPEDALRAAVRGILAAPPDVAVFVTGIGARHLLAAAQRDGTDDALREALRAARVVARGGKARRALREHDVPVAWTAEPPESRAVRDRLLAEGVTGLRILVQCAGAAPDLMVAPLRAAGAEVVEAHPYDIDVPPDARAAVALAEDAAAGRVDAITFTSANAAHGFAAIIERAGVDAAAIAGSGTLIAAVGPVTRAALASHGLPVHVEPATPRMGAMFHALAAALAARAGAER